ncbi:MAG TPA: hypothetical protein VFS67_11425 [Polyangiaceae bacterium]|nr:hypothetical protein [Polyangiaceae bacterium]
MNELSSTHRPPTRQMPRALLAALALFCLAPTPGDIGGCGQPARDLDPQVFFESQQAIECRRCEECSIRTRACEDACDAVPVPDQFPDGCYPLVHDGTVCLRALTQSSCAVHLEVMSDPPRVPSECNFCPALP